MSHWIKPTLSNGLDLILKAVGESTSKGRAIGLCTGPGGLPSGPTGPLLWPFGPSFGVASSGVF